MAQYIATIKCEIEPKLKFDVVHVIFEKRLK